MNSSYTYVFINQQGQQQKTQLSQHMPVKSCAICRKHQKTCWSSKKPPLQKHMLPRKLCSVGVVLAQFCTFVWWICPCTHALTGQAPTQHIATSRTKLLEDVECQKRSGQSGFSRVSGQKYRKRFRGSYEPCSWLLRLFRVHRDEEVHRQMLVQDLSRAHWPPASKTFR